MDNFFPGSAGLLSLPLPLPGSSTEGPKPLLKSTSLSRLDELQQYLKQCDDQEYKRRYFKMLSSCPTDVLDDYAKQLKNRAVWLATEEQREYKRAKLLNVMGDPLAPSHNADADAFCSKVLEDDFPEDECVTPDERKTGSRTPHNLQLRQCGAQQAALATASSQQRQVGECGYDAVAGAAPAVGRLEGVADLCSPPAHITVMDHHLPSSLTPLTASFLRQPLRSGAVEGGMLQTQLDGKPAH